MRRGRRHGPDPQSQTRWTSPGSGLALARSMPSMSLADKAMDEGRGLSLAVIFNPARAEKLFAGSGHTLAEILDADAAHKPLPRFPIPARIKATVAVARTEVKSQNVVAILPGSDPKLAGEYVVFSAHLDHIGVGKPINGDSIYNGAMDNASGVAGLLDVAEILKETGSRPKRSVLFLAVTGEEKGLQGSRFFANAPTVDAKAIVADINTDMFLPLYPLKSLIVFGLDETDLKVDVTAVAKAAGLAVLPDPEPKRNIFIRSDQYSFVRQGIPSLDADGRLREGIRRGSHIDDVAQGPLPRAVRRREPAGRQGRRRIVQRPGRQAGHTHRGPRRAAALERFVVLQAVRALKRRRKADGPGSCAETLRFFELEFAPNGAVTCQPRATPWVMELEMEFAPNGAVTCQPRATPWVLETRLIRALKGLNTMFSSGGTLFICH